MHLSRGCGRLENRAVKVEVSNHGDVFAGGPLCISSQYCSKRLREKAIFLFLGWGFSLERDMGRVDCQVMDKQDLVSYCL
jgi:hypothetical protein